ncbi:MAG: bifunctional UDP-N-acetylglucosamine diphosphorylase/glucosamine-1-phosphate N-acetyltransferase GlmU [Pseudomonadota bacterium]
MTQRIGIILAAGKGTRMKSDLPKVMHPVAGKPMLDWSIDLARSVGCDRIIVVCSPEQALLHTHVDHILGPGHVAIQSTPLGTGDAVKAAASQAGDGAGTSVVLYGDTPLIQPQSINALIETVESGKSVGVLGFEAAEPGAYGRLIQDADGDLIRIVEARDATSEEIAVTLCNSGVMAAKTATLFDLLGKITNENAKGEYYLTDIIGLAVGAGGRCGVVMCEETDVQGVNSRSELAAANSAFQIRRRQELMADGVTLDAPETVFLSHDTAIGQDAHIEANVVFGPGVRVAGGAKVRAFSHIEGASIAAGAVVGPFARIRPGTVVGEDCRVGNFVEVKNVQMGEGSKINHLSYAGDGSIGASANIGAGTIFCNYNGFEKHKTQVGAGAFVGSNSALLAPVTIGDGAYIGSGSVITKDVPADALAVARGRQIERKNWAKGYRASMRSGKTASD